MFYNKAQALDFFEYLNHQHPNIKFTYEEQTDNKLPFLDILINNNDNDILISVFHKSTYTGLLTNFKSFVPFQYKIGLVKTLVDRIFRINNSWIGFDRDLKDLVKVLGRNCFPMWIIDKTIKSYLNKKIIHEEKAIENVEAQEIRYFKLPYIGKYSMTVKNKVNEMVKKYCKSINVKLIFTTCKTRDSFSNKDRLIGFRYTTNVVYKYVCARCNASYVGETTRHLSVRIKEHYKYDKKSHVYKHIKASLNCEQACNDDCFSVLDRASTEYQLKIKEGMYIGWEQPTLNKQLYSYKMHLIV